LHFKLSTHRDGGRSYVCFNAAVSTVGFRSRFSVAGKIVLVTARTPPMCDQTRSVEANLPDDGIDDTLASVGTTIQDESLDRMSSVGLFIP
jgi:hypothetical protein